MAKKITVSLLIIFILLLAAQIIFTYLGRRSEDNFFNSKLRPIAMKSAFLRKILVLHNDGDARFEYLNNKIRIEVDAMENIKVNYEALELVKAKIMENVGNEASLLVSNADIPYVEQTDEAAIEAIAKNYRNLPWTKSEASLYILLVSRDKQDLDSLGLTFHEDGIIVYANSHEDFTASNPKTYSNYIASTILHEFGHQIGLPHNENKNCLMNTHAGEELVARQSISEVITDFCEYEKGQIKSLQQGY